MGVTLCGGDPPGFVGGCQQEVDRAEAYRCTHCTAWFHRACADDHFETDAYVKSLRDERNRACIVDWKVAVAKAESERDVLRGVCERLVAVLRIVQWAGPLIHNSRVSCPVCEGTIQSGGHKADCRIEQALASANTVLGKERT